MAQRRMFSLSVVDTDAFLELPSSSQALYFHLGMRADDDGFVASPKKITTMTNCSVDDLKLLAAKKFIIPFQTGVCVIRDWKQNNLVQKDRYHRTKYLAEMQSLTLDETGSYVLLDTECIQNVSKLETEVRLGKVRLGKEDTFLSEPASGVPDEERKRKKKSFDHEHKAYKLAEWLDAKIAERLPDCKRKTEEELQKWALTFDRMNRCDGYDYDAMFKILEWSQRNSFWQSNILSPDKFRAQFIQLSAKMKLEEAQNG